MKSRDRVIACLNFKKPDRTPRDLWAIPWVVLYEEKKLEELKKRYPVDIVACQPNIGLSEEMVKITKKPGSYIDEWGSVWYLAEPGVVGEVKKPVIDDWSKFKTFKPPYDYIKNRDIPYINNLCAKTDKFVLSDGTGRPFERLQFLRGTQNLFLDIGYDLPEFYKLLKIVHEFYLADIENWCKTDVDGIFFMDDVSGSRGSLIDPKFWRKTFKPLYKEYCDMIHAAGKFAFYHTCGNTELVFSDFIEVGIDAINSQLFLMNIEELASKYKGKITFWGELDRQNVLPFGTPRDVRNAVYRVKRAFEDGTGGVIAQFEWGKKNPIENIEAAFEAWNEKIF